MFSSRATIKKYRKTRNSIFFTVSFPFFMVIISAFLSLFKAFYLKFPTMQKKRFHRKFSRITP